MLSSGRRGDGGRNFIGSLNCHRQRVDKVSIRRRKTQRESGREADREREKERERQ